MKRLLTLGLALALLFTLCACQGAQTPPDGASSASTSASVSDPADASASTDPADGSTDLADLSALLEQGLDAQSGSASAAPVVTVEEPELDVQRGPRTFGLSMPKHAAMTQKAVADALEERLNKLGDTLVRAQDAGSAEEQIQQLNALADAQVSAIFVCPVDGAALEETVAALSQRAMPLFGFGDWDYLPEGMVSVVRSDEYNAGYVCGMDLAEQCPDGGDVLVLERPDSNQMMERAAGFMEAAEESGVELEVLDELEVQESSKATLKLIKDTLKENPQVVGLFSASDRDAEAALKAVAGTGCLVYSGDGSPERKAELGKNANLAGLGAQSPAGIAAALEDNANEYLDGEAVEEERSVGTFLITAENVERFGVDGWQ